MRLKTVQDKASGRLFVQVYCMETHELIYSMPLNDYTLMRVTDATRGGRRAL